jgi:putative ABC transport system permease protein
MTLAFWLIKAQFQTRFTATLLSMLAIALGVALGFAIDLINAAALNDFSRAMKSVQGEPDAVIAPRDSAASVPLAVVNFVARDPAVMIVAPVIELRVRIDNESATVRLIGLDVLTAPAVMPDLLPRPSATVPGTLFDDGVYVSRALATRLKRKAGDEITITRGDATWRTPIKGDLPAARGDELIAVADIAWVQARMGAPDAVSEARIRLAANTDVETWRTSVSALLPAGLIVKGAADDAARVSNLSRAYRVNLNVLALVALLTGGFLVFATQLTAVAQRSTQFALLGVLGLTPTQRMAQVLFEAAAIGIPGSALGLALGYALAFAFTRLLGGDLGGGYFSGRAPTIAATPLSLLIFFTLGCTASLLGAAYPAWLNRTQPLAAALKTGFAHRPPQAHKQRGVLLVALSIVAVALSQAPAIAGLPFAGYAAIAVVLVIGIVAAPLATHALFSHLSRYNLPAALRIAVQNVAQAPLMAQVAASGLIVSFALTVSMVIMVSSFRVAVDTWLDEVLPAPFYARSKATPLPQAALDALQRPDVPFAKSESAAFSSLTLDVSRPAVALLVRELDRNDPGSRLPFTGPVISPPPEQTVVWVSEPMAELYNLAPGQRMRLPLLGRDTEVFIGGVWRDYARQFGSVVISRSDYEKLGGRFEPTDLALWPREGKDAAAKNWLGEYVKQYGLEFSESAEIRRLSLSIFDKSFAVTYALEAAAMMIGLFGLAVTLAASVWLRARELATLSALGFDRAMLTRAVMFEGLMIAVIGLALGLACGVAIGALLTHVVNPQAFHWRMQLHIPWFVVMAGVVLTLVAGLVASRFAARQTTLLPAAQVLGSVQ